MESKKKITHICLILAPFFAFAQHKERPKIEHAEPLYIDLIRDLGARKGEKEWNFAFGLTDKRKYDNYQALVEYEFAPADRLGMEFEIPVTFYTAAEDQSSGRSSKIESFKSAIQWTFMVSERYQSSFALGYINEILLTDFNSYGREPLVSGNLFNPFLVMAKRLGAQFHSLVYTGPRIEKTFRSPAWDTSFEINTSFHYMVPNTRNFIGVEFNKEIESDNFNFVARPQMRVSIADNLLIGIVTGIPLMKEDEKLSSFLRLIWEPGHRH